MKRLLIMLVLSLMGFNVCAADNPSLLVYMSPEKYHHPTVVGIAPMYTRWVDQAEIAENAAAKALTGSFSDVGVCEQGKNADVVAWVKPRLVYNPAVSSYYAKLKVELHLSDGRSLATYKATGHEDAALTSIYQDAEVARAFDDAMRQIMAQIQADTALQSNIQAAMRSDFTRNPCGMIAVLASPKDQDWFFEYIE